jgi:hypothetical protein
MAKPQVSSKRLAIDKDNAHIVLAVGLATFMVVFSLFACKALLSQRSYQAKVIGKKKIALRQLEANIKEVSSLKTAYQEFANAPQNVLGGNPAGNGDKDGENPRIILDALPSKYDFPALTTSVSKMLTGQKIELIKGVDDEVNQSAGKAAGAPKEVEIPFSATVSTSSEQAKGILELFERSIRPMQIDKLTISGGGSQLKMTIGVRTYFQPASQFNVKKEVVK